MSQPLADLREPVNALYYGDGGTGKTTDLIAMANLGPIEAVNAEAGIKARPLRQRGIEVENVSLYDGEITFEGLQQRGLEIREELNADPDAYAGIVWDSVTEIYQKLLADVVAAACEKAKRAGKDRDPSFVALEDYGVMTQQMRTLVRLYRDLPCHFGLSALSKREQDDDGSVLYQPQVTGKLQNDLVGWVDIVCVTQTRQVGGVDEFVGLFRPHKKFRGKDRLGALPKFLVDPTFDRVVGYVDGDIEVGDDPVMVAARERAAEQKAEPAEAETAEPVPA